MDTAALDSTSSTADTPAKTAQKTPFKDGDLPSFSDLLDIINPLQHIPVINTIYRKLTGDTEGAAADLIGGGLWGGPIGFVAALGDLDIQAATGKTVGEHVLALFDSSDDDDAGQTAVAQQAPPAAPVPSAADTPSAPPPAVLASAASPAVDSRPAGPISLMPQPVVTNEPLPDITIKADSGPVAAGDYLVFGGKDDTPTQTTTASTVPSPERTPKPVPETADDGVTMAGDMMVFGAAAAAAASTASDAPPPVPATMPQPVAPATVAKTQGNFAILGANSPAAAAPPPLAAIPDSPAAAAPVQRVAAAPALASAAAAANARTFTFPVRRSQGTPSAVLPMPTTGPAALPGHSHSLATGTSVPTPSAEAAAGSAATTPVTDQTWFVNQFNDAMDKYQKAARLGTAAANDPSPATAATN